MPLLMVVISPLTHLVPIVSEASPIFLGVLGAVGATPGGADVVRDDCLGDRIGAERSGMSGC